jgi:hypothetical protein
MTSRMVFEAVGAAAGDEGSMGERMTEERVLDWLEGRLPEAEAAEVSRRVEDDERLVEQVRWMRAFLRASERIELSAPPREVRQELSRRFADFSEGRRQPGLLGRMVASLQFDSGFQVAPAGTRAGAPAGHRQLAFATEAADVAVSMLRRRGENLDLEGQVFPSEGQEPDSFVVQLLDGVREVSITTTGEFGEFSFEDVAPGKYSMFLSTGNMEILISPLELSREA